MFLKGERNEMMKLETKPRLTYEVLHYRKGKLLHHIKSPCHSFTRWFTRIMGCVFCGESGDRFLQLQVIAEDGNTYRIDSYPRIELRKMAIGASNQAFSYDDYRLIDKRVEALKGTDNWTTTIPPTESGTSVYFEHQGKHPINTEFDVWECGLFSYTYMTDQYSHYVLITRDVLPNPIHVLPGDVVFVRYRGTVSI
jgi:hypothetical protein